MTLKDGNVSSIWTYTFIMSSVKNCVGLRKLRDSSYKNKQISEEFLFSFSHNLSLIEVTNNLFIKFCVNSQTIKTHPKLHLSSIALALKLVENGIYKF